MAGLLILKHTHDLSDEVLCARWLENPYYQFFCGEESFQHVLPSDRSSLIECSIDHLVISKPYAAGKFSERRV